MRALHPDAAAFVDRHGRGPTSLTALRRLLVAARQRGRADEADEDGEVTPGSASVAVAVLDHNASPVAGVAVTWDTREAVEVATLVEAVTATARTLSHRVGWRG